MIKHNNNQAGTCVESPSRMLNFLKLIYDTGSLF